MEETNEMQNELSVETTPQEAVTNETATTQDTTTVEQPQDVETPVETPANEEPVTETETIPEPESKTEEPTEVKEEPKEEEEPIVDYTGKSREELIEALKELLTIDDITKIKNRVGAIKVCFAEADKATKKAAFDKFIEEGGNTDDYEGGDDETAENYRKVYAIYRERRQKHIDELEATKQRNLELKKQILEELRKLIDDESESLKRSPHRTERTVADLPFPCRAILQQGEDEQRTDVP